MAEPPAKRRRLSEAGASRRPGPASLSCSISPPGRRSAAPVAQRKIFPSPFRLTVIRDLPPASNIGAVSLQDLLGDPLIAECWDFNYLHDIDWLMTHFDQDTRSLVKVHIVHGFWKKEDPSRIMLHVSLGFTLTLESFHNAPEGDDAKFNSKSLTLATETSCRISECQSPYGLHVRDVRYTSL